MLKTHMNGMTMTANEMADSKEEYACILCIDIVNQMADSKEHACILCKSNLGNAMSQIIKYIYGDNFCNTR